MGRSAWWAGAVVVAMGLGAALPIRAQAPADPAAERIKALEARLEQTLRQLEQLNARVAELERAAGAKPSAVAASAPGAAAAAAPEAAQVRRLQDTVNQLSDSLSRAGRDAGVPVHGFADVSAAASGRGDPQRVRGFQAGTLDIYLTPQIGERGRSLFETVFEFDAGGNAHVEAERLQLGYTVSDALTLWMGRFHTPIGLWNTAFHHGTHLQTTLARPRFLEFEDRGGILPTHTVGLWASSRARLGDGRVSADVFAGNGPRVRGRELDINGFSDDNGNVQWGGRLSYAPNGLLRGLTVGAHALDMTVNSYADDGTTVLSRNRWRLAGLHAGYDDDHWSLLAEAHRVRTASLLADTRARSTLWYVQLGRVIGAWTPYARVERAALDTADSYFASLRTGRPYRRQIGGVRYDLDTRSAVKLELSRTNESDTTLVDGQGLQVPFNATRYHRAAIEYSIAF